MEIFELEFKRKDYTGFCYLARIFIAGSRKIILQVKTVKTHHINSGLKMEIKVQKNNELSPKCLKQSQLEDFLIFMEDISIFFGIFSQLYFVRCKLYGRS